MSIQLVLDSIAGCVPTDPVTIRQGARLTIVGWAMWTHDRTVAAPIIGRLDGMTDVVAHAQSRDDVAVHFGVPSLREAGFELDFGVSLSVGRHEVLLGTGEGPRFAPVLRLTIISLASPTSPSQPWPRIVIAAAPKSGSTFALSILSRYFGTQPPPLSGIFWAWEQNLDGWVTARIRDHPFVLQMHLRAYAQNLAVIKSLGITPVITWRNLADTIISADDHHRKEAGAMFLLMMDDPADFARMPDQDRYQMLIRQMIPWYMNFYVSWRKQQPPIFMHYEWLAVDPVGYFSHIIKSIAGSVDTLRLHQALGTNLAYPDSRRNAGVNGRANEKMSDETKALLESTLRAPFFEDVSELLRELPWNDGAAAVLPTALAPL